MKYSIWKIPANISTLSFSPIGKTIKYKTSVLAETTSFEAGDKVLVYSEQPTNSFNIGITIIEQNDDTISFIKDFEVAGGVSIDTLSPELVNKILTSPEIVITITESEYQSIRSLLFSQEKQEPKPSHTNDRVQQIIYYGAPGTGKSYGIKRNHGVTKENSFRTTFHPDSDYSTFVGCYKPMKQPNGTDITYDFVPQVFTEAYIKAWENYAVGKQIFLIIEEINRGNCAQIFGDLFQLLDRDEQGFSDYEIKPEKDLQDYLADKLSKLSFEEPRLANIPSGEELILPPNLNIIATMNTSDQSLFPIDSAFKRRWSWRYTAIKDANKDYRFEMPDGTQYGWWDFLHQVNDKIKAVTESEDKKMGYFFVRPNKKQRKADERATIVTLDLFVSKVLFYLWTDIFKDYADDVENNIFRKFVKKDENGNDIYESLTFNDFFDEVGKVDPTVVEAFLVQFKLKPKEIPTEDEVEETVITGKDNCLVVTLPNGKVIQEDKNNQTFATVISEIATTVPGAIEILKTMNCGNYPLLSEEKLVPSNPDPKEFKKEKLYADQQREFVVDGTTYYLHTKLATAEMRARIERLLTKLYPDQVHPLEIGGYKVEMTYA